MCIYTCNQNFPNLEEQPFYCQGFEEVIFSMVLANLHMIEEETKVRTIIEPLGITELVLEKLHLTVYKNLFGLHQGANSDLWPGLTSDG